MTRCFGGKLLFTGILRGRYSSSIRKKSRGEEGSSRKGTHPALKRGEGVGIGKDQRSCGARDARPCTESHVGQGMRKRQEGQLNNRRQHLCTPGPISFLNYTQEKLQKGRVTKRADQRRKRSLLMAGEKSFSGRRNVPKKDYLLCRSRAPHQQGKKGKLRKKTSRRV